MRAAPTLHLAATLVTLASPALADTHFFYAGFFSQEYVSGFEFNDETNNLTLIDNYAVTAGSSRWIATDVRTHTTPPNKSQNPATRQLAN